MQQKVKENAAALLTLEKRRKLHFSKLFIKSMQACAVLEDIRACSQLEASVYLNLRRLGSTQKDIVLVRSL